MSILGNLARLRGRSRDELVERAAQYLAARAERVGWRDAREPSPAELSRLLDPRALDGRPSLAEWHVRHQQGTAAPFYAGLADRDATIAALRRLVPDAELELTARADRMLSGRFDLLGYHGLQYRLPIDWHLDPVSGVRAPNLHWSQIAFLDPAVAGDHKAIWEINRHQILVTLGQAYWYTGDERYAARAASWLSEWMDANPPKRGINWASSLEVAFRSISWLWTLQLLRQSPSLTHELFTRSVGHLTIAARHLERYLSTYFSPNTHLTGEALGLYHLGVQLAPFELAAGWRARGLRILLDQLPRHVRPDGVYFEQATYYQRYTAEFYLHLLLLAECAGDDIGATVRPPLAKLLESLQATMRPDGTIPLIGDDDGGRLMFFDASSGSDIRGLLAAGATALGRDDFADGAGGPRPDVVWLLGAKGSAEWDVRRPAPPALASRAFMHGGVLVMRDGWSRQASVMVIDCGPHGVYNCGHAHADALAFDLTVDGQPVFVDPGTYTYTTAPAERDAFRSTAVHNTVSLNGQSSSLMRGPFSWATVAQAAIERWHTSALVDYFEGTHDGYERPGTHAELVRAITFVKDGYWIVRDRVVTRARVDATATLQCAIGLTTRVLGASEIGVEALGRELARVFVLGDGVATGLDDGWVSPAYGVRQQAPRIRVQLKATGPAAFESVIVAARLHARVARRRGASCDIVEVRHGSFVDATAFADGGDHPENDGVLTDADMFWIRRDARSGVPIACFATGATHVRVDGELVAQSPVPGAVAAVRTAGGWIPRDVAASTNTPVPDEASVAAHDSTALAGLAAAARSSSLTP